MAPVPVVAGLGAYVDHGLTSTPVVTRPEGVPDDGGLSLYVGMMLLAEGPADPIPTITELPDLTWIFSGSPVDDDTDVARSLILVYHAMLADGTEPADYTFTLSAPCHVQTGLLLAHNGVSPHENMVGETAEGTGGAGARVPQITVGAGHRLIIAFGFAPATGYAFGFNGTIGGYTVSSPEGSGLYREIDLPAGTVIAAETDDASVTAGWTSLVFTIKDNIFAVKDTPAAPRRGLLGE